jgi:AcrR family transcriptional regulator
VRERQMVAVARRAFSGGGYHGASMEAIAAEVGVSKPMLYSYFGSKEGLFEACVEDATRELMEVLEREVGRERTPELRMWRGFVAVFAFIEENEESWQLLYPYGPASGGPFAVAAERASDEMARLLARLLGDSALEQGIDPDVVAEGVEPMAYALVAATEGLASWWLKHRDHPKEYQALRLMNLTWSGLANLVEGRLWEPPPEAFEGL